MVSDNSASQDPAFDTVRERRPKIPIPVAREVLIESGHRCAVCGDSCPLERAHIIAWCESREHSVENLICLCASCHQRADLENWGARTLREYKRRPWILRKGTESALPISPKLIQLSLSMEFESFDARTERLLIHALAAFLDIPPDTIKVLAVEKGSVKLLLELPSHAAERLLRVGGLISLEEYLDIFGEIQLAEASEPSAALARSPGMDCKEVSAAVFLFFDNEMDESLLVPFRDHIANCAECAKRIDYTRKLLLIVRERCTSHAAPNHLLDRILTTLPRVGLAQKEATKEEEERSNPTAQADAYGPA